MIALFHAITTNRDWSFQVLRTQKHHKSITFFRDVCNKLVDLVYKTSSEYSFMKPHQ